MKRTGIIWVMLAAVCVGGAALSAEEIGSALLLDNAKWIGFTKDTREAGLAKRASLYRNQPKPVQRRTYPAPLLRKEFTVEKPVRAATVIVCGLGLHELVLNGVKVGDRVLDPAQTTYDKRAFYTVHDVTRQLRQGANAIGLMLGNGFYGQNFAFGGGLGYGPPRAQMGLLIQYTDGTTDRVVTDESWRAAQGAVLFDNIYAGETYDARRELSGWSSPGFDAAEWEPVRTLAAPGGQLEEQLMEPMRKIRPVNPVAVFPAGNGEWIVDLGQNITGWLQIRVDEPRGTQIRMRFAELLMPDGKSIDTASTGVHVTSADQMDVYVCKGGGVEEWEPRFTYHGFRYVQIAGLSRKPVAADFTGWLVRTDVARIGRFECSDPLIQKFYEVSMWTIEDNLQGLLSDCPHRERCAWMGDMHAVGEAASCNFDLRKFWRKASADMQTVLGANPPHNEGGLPRDPRAPCNIAVGRRLCQQARPDWGAATVLVPWFSYLYYGDLDLVREAWPMMTGWMAFLEEFAVKDGLIAAGYGDWCPPGSNSQIDTPVALTSTALYYQSLEAMRRMAAALGKPSEASRFAAQAGVVQQAFNARFYKESEVPVEPVPSGTSIVLIKALYGVPSRQVDLTEKLRGLVDGGAYSFKVSNRFAGKDPAPGKRKTLELEYTLNGESKKQTLNENEIGYLVTESIGSYGSQTGTAMALHVGLVPDGKAQAVGDGLAALIMKKSGGRYTTGIFGHRPLYTMLNDHGHADITRHLWSLTDWPSLGFLTEQHGLTTWPEVPFDWPAGERYRRNSFNHPMHSGFAVAFHESIGGIRPDPEHPGFKRFILKPCFLPGLAWAKAEYRSAYGLISSRWERDGDAVVWNVTVPENSSATVLLDTGRITLNGRPLDSNGFELQAGEWVIGVDK
ncbi:family 78 glycoside hydrolase catalytic domain [Pontiellaceae bacterium B12227]|nr:family 78 glycoside hydrolase catalytic domain [Pontiellaceae bacterium B12227]